jgi:hypothetical protein
VESWVGSTSAGSSGSRDAAERALEARVAMVTKQELEIAMVTKQELDLARRAVELAAREREARARGLSAVCLV